MDKQLALEAMKPPPEQLASAVFVEDVVVDRKPGKNMVIGRAYQRRPMIDILAQQGLFSDAEYRALVIYRHYAGIADRSPLRDSLNREPGKGNREGMTLAMITACAVTCAREAAAGRLVAILRAVAVEDVSLSQWAIQQGGGIEITRQRSGKPKTVIEPTDRAFAHARLDMRIAAQRLEAELAA